MATLFKSIIFVLLLLIVYVPGSEHHGAQKESGLWEDEIVPRDPNDHSENLTDYNIHVMQKAGHIVGNKPKKGQKPTNNGKKDKKKKVDDKKNKKKKVGGSKKKPPINNKNHKKKPPKIDDKKVKKKPPKGKKGPPRNPLINPGQGKPAGPKPAGPKTAGDYETGFLGSWKLDKQNAGVSAMHMQILRNNKAIIFDATNFGQSGMLLQPPGTCYKQKLPNNVVHDDCWAHAIEYDLKTADIRTLMLTTNSWCSSGGTTPDGRLISAGGTDDGGRVVRTLDLCPNCDWRENPTLARTRWYSSMEKLEDGTFIIAGGRREPNIEFVQNSLNFQPRNVDSLFLKQNGDLYENNLYPFVYLLPDGNVFLFANRQGAILDPKSTNILRKFPNITGPAARNYPGSAGSALLPLKLRQDNTVEKVEVLICGGALWDATRQAELNPRVYIPAAKDCGRIDVMNPKAQWQNEDMPTPRVMGDMLLLPTGNVLLINGAMKGCAGWYDADDPNFTPLMYYPNKPPGQRFKKLAPSTIARMYHSSAAVLPDGNILVAGSSPNNKYEFTTAKTKYPTELRVEKFTPPYMDTKLDQYRPSINEQATQKVMRYGTQFVVTINDKIQATKADLMVSLLPPPFTTHGYSQNQRLVIPYVVSYEPGKLKIQAPPNGKIAPPGYYLLSVVNRGVPSRAMWVQITK